MEEWQETRCGVSKHQGMFRTARCRVSGEAKRYQRADAQQARRRGYPRMQVNRSRASMKGGVRKVHLRQHQDQHDKKQQAH